MSFYDNIHSAMIQGFLLVVILLITRQFEKRRPVEADQPAAAVIVDYKLALLRFFLQRLLSPVTGACAIMLVNAAGGGWIQLRIDGWWFMVSFIVLVLAFDFYAYFVHRAQHKFPVLWAMHSLHHSAEALSMVTGARHYWLETSLFAAGFPILAIIFKIPPELGGFVTLFYLIAGDGLAHLNMRLSLGRFALCVQNPQLHRIHHSVEPQHRDKNFCKLLPLFDVIFGTAYMPGKDEYPKTGLDGEKATGFLDGLVWPIRHKLPSLVKLSVARG